MVSLSLHHPLRALPAAGAAGRSERGPQYGGSGKSSKEVSRPPGVSTSVVHLLALAGPGCLVWTSVGVSDVPLLLSDPILEGPHRGRRRRRGRGPRTSGARRPG
eukprot:1645920-Pyramimonas_sp.AAC.1